MTLDTYKDQPVFAFETPEAWRAWLDAHHAESRGMWLRLYKKASGRPTISYAEALDEALCYGWIDSTKAAGDAESYLQRFSPRQAKSIWSKVNREHVARLVAEGRMLPAGQAAIDEAKRNGQWDAAYDAQSRMAVPEDFAALLAAHPEASAFFESLNKANRYAILFRIQTAKKPETRQRRLEWALDLLERKEKVH